MAISFLRAFLLVFAISTCAIAHVNYREESRRQFLGAEKAVASGDLKAAKDGYVRALESARAAGDIPVGAQVALTQKLARVLGNLCEREPAERTFLEAIALAEKTSGATSPATFPLRVELAQFAFDTEQFEKASGYFEQAFSVGETILSSKQPVAMAVLLEDYGIALERSGKTADAEAARNKAATLRKRGGEATVVNTKKDYTPYPKTCK